MATLTSVAPYVEEPDPALVTGALEHLRWDPGDLDPELPPRVAYAGARHLILAARTRERLADLDYDFDALKALMLDHDLITVALVWREDPRTFHARDPFPVGGVVEDPATGAAAAAFGAYLRELGAVDAPGRPDHPPGRGHGPAEHAGGARGHARPAARCASAGPPWRITDRCRAWRTNGSSTRPAAAAVRSGGPDGEVA